MPIIIVRLRVNNRLILRIGNTHLHIRFDEFRFEDRIFAAAELVAFFSQLIASSNF